MSPTNEPTPASSPELVVLGELNVDLILERLNALPELDTERLAHGMTFALGSSSAILASNASAMGLRTGFIGRVGRDSFGKYIVERLKSRGVDTTHVIETDGASTGLTAIYTYGTRRGAITYPGAMEMLTLTDVPWEYVSRARHLHLSSYYLQPGLKPDVAELFRRAKAHGLTTSFDTNWDPTDTWGDDVFDVLEHADVFLPNDDEARRISGEEELGRAMEVLAQHAQCVVVTCGAEGVRAFDRSGSRQMPAVQVTPVDAVGAGDSFNAGFLSRYLKDAPLEECLWYGVLAGAYSTTAAGGTSAFDDPEGFRRFAADAISHPMVSAP